MRQNVFNLMAIDLEKIKKEITENNALIIYPTDTVYGVGGSMYSIEAIKRSMQLRKESLLHLLLPL